MDDLAPAEPAKASRERPSHYRVVCFSMYLRDLDAMDVKLRALKERGFTRASKSSLLRLALARLDVAALTDAEIGAVP